MKPGQRLQRWWQEYVLGGLKTPQAIHAASRAETPDKVEIRAPQHPESLPPVDHPQWDTPKRLQAPGFLLSTSYAAQQQRADWQQTDQRLAVLFARVILRAAKLGIPLYVHSAFRTKAEQDTLVRRKVTKAPYPRSAHNIGEAVDLVHGVYHWDLTKREWAYLHWLVQDEQRKVNALLPKARKLALNWGGDDGTHSDTFKWDPAHWEILDYRNRTRVMPVADPLHRSPSVTVVKLRL